MVLRSLRDRLGRFNVSVAETAYQDDWNRAEITVAYVSANNAHADSMEEKIDAFIEQARDMIITSTKRHRF